MSAPLIVGAAEIPQLVNGGMEVRELLGHPGLAALLPNATVRLAWVSVAAQRSTRQHSLAHASLLAVLGGRATLTSDTSDEVAEGDVVTLPEHQPWSISAGKRGFSGLHVNFEPAALVSESTPDASSPESSRRAFEQLLEQNQQRARRMLRASFFSLLKTGDIKNDKLRRAVADALRIFADEFQTLLFTRQATCRDERYSTLFREHLAEELGHNELLESRDCSARRDPVLRATSTWFAHQMLVLDNVDKVVVNLVLETAGHHLGTLAKPLFTGHSAETFFDTHGEADASHMDIGVELLQGHSAHTYRRLSALVDRSWDMLTAMTERIVAHVESARREES